MIHLALEATTEAQVRRWYSVQEIFAVSDQRLFDLPLSSRLATSIRSQKHWLTLVARYHSTTKSRRQGNQQLISTFFQHNNSNPAGTRSTNRLPDPEALEHPPNITTQQYPITQPT